MSLQNKLNIYKILFSSLTKRNKMQKQKHKNILVFADATLRINHFHRMVEDMKDEKQYKRN